MEPDVNGALLQRLEKVIETLSENSVKMGQMLAVHDEKLDKQDRIDAVLFETKQLKRTKVAEPPAVTTLVLVLLTASVTTLDLVSILKVFAILS